MEALHCPFQPGLRRQPPIVSTLLYGSRMQIASVHFGRRLHKSGNTRTQESLGAVLEAGYHTVCTNTSRTLSPYQHLQIDLIHYYKWLYPLYGYTKRNPLAFKSFPFFFLAILVLLFKQSLGEYLSVSLHTCSLRILPPGTMCQVMLKTLRKIVEDKIDKIPVLTGNGAEARNKENL